MSDDAPTTTEQPAPEGPEAVPAVNVAVAYEDASRLLTSGGTAQSGPVQQRLSRRGPRLTA